MGLNRDGLGNLGPITKTGLGMIIVAHHEFPNFQMCARALVEALTK